MRPVGYPPVNVSMHGYTYDSQIYTHFKLHDSNSLKPATIYGNTCVLLMPEIGLYVRAPEVATNHHSPMIMQQNQYIQTGNYVTEPSIFNKNVSVPFHQRWLLAALGVRGVLGELQY